MRKYLLATVLVIPLMGFMGCSSDGDGDKTPRQTAAQVDDAYSAVQTIALNLINSGKVSDAVEAQIKTAEGAAYEAVIAYHDAATRCVEIDGVIKDAPGLPEGLHCDDSLIGLTQGAAIALISNAKQLLSAF